jgi:hypothetical protein
VEDINHEEETPDQEEADLAKETDPDQGGRSKRNGDLSDMHFVSAVEDVPERGRRIMKQSSETTSCLSTVSKARPCRQVELCVPTIVAVTLNSWGTLP